MHLVGCFVWVKILLFWNTEHAENENNRWSIRPSKEHRNTAVIMVTTVYNKQFNTNLLVAASHIITVAISKYNASLDSVLHHPSNQRFVPSELSDGSFLLQQQKPFMWKHYWLIDWLWSSARCRNILEFERHSFHIPATCFICRNSLTL